MQLITESITLTPGIDWNIVNMLPIKFTVTPVAVDVPIEITLPNPSKIKSGAELTFKVTTFADQVSFSGTDSTVNDLSDITLEDTGLYTAKSINGGWYLTGTYISKPA